LYRYGKRQNKCYKKLPEGHKKRLANAGWTNLRCPARSALTYVSRSIAIVALNESDAIYGLKSMDRIGLAKVQSMRHGDRDIAYMQITLWSPARANMA
jgi:hypothetical protein